MDRISSLRGGVTIYTDGSASAGTLDGGAAAIITTGNPQRPRVIDTLKKRGAIFTSSYDEEVLSMDMAVTWLEENRPATAVIVTDSQSLCEAIQA